MFVYRNVNTGQVVESETVLSRLDGLARWERSEVDRPKAEPVKAAPRKRSTPRRSA